MVIVNSVNAQFSEDFSDDELLNNPAWIGDLDDFIVNQNSELQLNATDAGSSKLFTPISYASDINWEIDVRLDFSPSGSNQLTVFLLSTDVDSPNKGILYLEIGQTGSDDAIRLFSQDNEEPIATGISGRFASAPDAKININLSNAGLLTATSIKASEEFESNEFSVQLSDIAFGDYFFGVQCDYTSTRKDKFFFRSITIREQEAQEDITAPKLIETIVNNSQVCLRFNEVLDEKLSQEESIVQIDNVIIDEIIFEGNQIKINNLDMLPEGDFNISLIGISDQSGNRLDTLFSVFLPVLPNVGELVINELLFDPVRGGEDFLEIVNNSEKTFDLKGLVISNTQNGRSVTITQSIIVEPMQIVAFAPNKDQIIDYYPSANAEQIYSQTLPAFGNDGGNASVSINGKTLDEFLFSDDLHHPLLDDPEGVSLERVDPDLGSMEDGAWASASEIVGFATPGASNSTFRIGLIAEDMVSFNSNSFSPNGDGDMDELEIIITSKENSVGSIFIYDQSGNMVRKLNTNSLLGSLDTILWDGKLENGSRAPIGIYIIRIEVFNITGQVFDVKKAVALVDFIN